ncbi:hypothetical protein BCR32DRAFT_288623 [Anaeromyces robustus]|uniref:SH3 domain-containing protein n=1 Tax=Anaeromyces robustus TaxID=1754192 RepID=A0A1Y1UCV6_9FUNG|nr:hypothetical protein BCR32DRAFT_288623 [Anaeromyces robustus]|eukprot:ORX35842.1 hypothetical protein BCR32DRAFT_288623 [Anaeromyces robustus]
MFEIIEDLLQLFQISLWLYLFAFSFKSYDKSWYWWIIINGLISVVIVFIIIDKDLLHGYRFALMTYLGICINWTIGALHPLLHNDNASGNAVGVGQLLISVAYFIWILYFGCDKDTTVGKWTNSSGILRNIQTTKNNNSYTLQNVTSENPLSEPSITTTSPPVNLRAEALFDYTANKEDPNEISFSQGEVMDILDNNGRWWQARKADGTMGIVPSNFFKVI